MYCKYTNNLVNNNINFLNLTKFMLLANFANLEKLTNMQTYIQKTEVSQVNKYQLAKLQ